MLKTKSFKNQKKTIRKYRLIGGPILACQGGGRRASLPPPISYATDWPSWSGSPLSVGGGRDVYFENIRVLKAGGSPELWCCDQDVKAILLRSDSPSGMCAKLHTVAASNNRDHAPQSFYILFVPHTYGRYSSRTSRW